jgi:predicted ABC-type ATPase
MDTAFDLAAHHPWVVVLGGPNGAGKSTAAPEILRDVLSVTEYVNADVIAAGLSGLDPDGAAVAAGRVMLTRLRELAHQRAAFAFETTLASRSFASWIDDLRTHGYHFRMIYLWLPNADVAVARVRQRALLGGHSVPEATIRRRYERGLRNLFDLYLPLADSWVLYDGSSTRGPRLVAGSVRSRLQEIVDERTWQAVRRSAGVE